MKKAYIAGKITGCGDYKQNFEKAYKFLRAKGYLVMNPAVLPEGFEHHEYMSICYSMIDAVDKVFFLPNWRESKGAKMELDYACQTRKEIDFETLKGVI